jgi:hypothetical protein
MKFLSILALAATPVLAQGQHARGSTDHPVLSRYPGSRIQTYSHVDFSQHPLALGVENCSRPQFSPEVLAC